MNKEVFMWALFAAVVIISAVFIIGIYLTKHRRSKLKRKMFILQLLEELRSDELKKSDGICTAFSLAALKIRRTIPNKDRDEYASEYLDLLAESCKELCAYTGNKFYPIAAPDNPSTSGENLFKFSLIKWGYSTAYSRAREAVLVRLIEKYEAILKELS